MASEENIIRFRKLNLYVQEIKRWDQILDIVQKNISIFTSDLLKDVWKRRNFSWNLMFTEIEWRRKVRKEKCIIKLTWFIPRGNGFEFFRKKLNFKKKMEVKLKLTIQWYLGTAAIDINKKEVKMNAFMGKSKKWKKNSTDTPSKKKKLIHSKVMLPLLRHRTSNIRWVYSKQSKDTGLETLSASKRQACFDFRQ